LDRNTKKQVVSDMNGVFNTTTTVIVAHYKGLTVAEVTALRTKMRQNGAEFKVTKNSLTKLSLANTQFENLSSMFIGPTAIAYSNDPVAAAKVLVDFSKDNENLVILGGMLKEQVMSAKEVNSLATLPSIDQLRAKILGILNTPATRIAGLVQAPAGQLARVIGAYASKGN